MARQERTPPWVYMIAAAVALVVAMVAAKVLFDLTDYFVMGPSVGGLPNILRTSIDFVGLGLALLVAGFVFLKLVRMLRAKVDERSL